MITISDGADIMFAANPRGTSLGAFCGVAFDGLLKLMAPALERARDWIAPERLNIYYTIALGVVVFNLPQFFRRQQLPEVIEQALEAIRLEKQEGKVSEAQVRMHYIALCQSVIDRVQLDQSKLPKPRRSARKEAI